jgi:hypothetical protein
MSNYDNTNKIALFEPRGQESVTKAGRINVNGVELKSVIVDAVTAKGKTVSEVYVKIGAIFPTKSDNEKAPHYSGPIEAGFTNMMSDPKNNMSLWLQADKNGNAYLAGNISFRDAPKTFVIGDISFYDITSKTVSQPVTTSIDDDIPF